MKMSFKFCPSVLILYLLSLGNGQDVSDIAVQETAARVNRASECGGVLKHSSLCSYDEVLEMKYELIMKTEYKTKCNFDKITVSWHVAYKKDGKTETATENTDQLSYTFRHYEFRATDLSYTLNAVVNSYLFDGTLIERNVTGPECHLSLQFLTPAAHINGGSMRVVKAKNDIIVDGSGSRNFAYSPLERGQYLKYKWECSKGSSSKCQGVSGLTDSKLKIGGQYVNNKDEFKVTLTVSAVQKGKIVYSKPSSQQIKVIASAVEVAIRCLKNCPPASDIVKPGDLTCLTVKCLKSCEGITDSDYVWAINSNRINYKTDTEYGQRDRNFFIKPYVLSGGQKYEVTLSIKGILVGTISLDVLAGWQLKNCVSDPKVGLGGQTMFSFTCNEVKGIHHITAVDSNGFETILVNGYPVITTLPINSKIYMKMIDAERQISTSEVETQVNDPFPANPSLEEFNKTAEEFIVHVRDFVKGTLHDALMQNITHSIKQLQKGSKSERGSIRRRFQEEVLKIFLIGASLDNTDYVYQTATVLRDLLNLHKDDIDVELAKLISYVCRKISEAQLKCIEKHAYQLDVGHQTLETTNILLDCIQLSYSVNRALLLDDEEENAALGVSTTPFPAVEKSSLEETYPDYAEEVAGSGFETMKIITMNYLAVRRLSGKAVSLTMAAGEKPITRSTNITSLWIGKQPGDKFTKEFSSQGVTIIPSNDFNNPSFVATGILCTAVDDPFWWNTDKDYVVTNVAVVEFHLDDKEVTKFKSPVNIYLKFKEEIFNYLPVISAEIPNRFNETLDDSVYIDHQDDIVIHRIDCWARGRYMVYFHNLTMDDSFDVVIKDFERPVLQDFKKKKMVVNKDSPFVFHSNDKNYDVWSYLAILRSANMSSSSGGVSKISFSIASPKCNRWNIEKSKWSPGCNVGAGTNATYLHCTCKSLSAFGGLIFYGMARHEKILRLNFTMELHICYIVPIACAIVLLLYCIIIAFLVFFKQNATKDVYFLSDVRFFQRYMYLVIVRTGNKIFSGTTSNVMIKITGDRGQSKEHVLNFPDPCYSLLNRGSEDWFVLATEKHLGRLKTIELWFDHIGARPTWYCSEIFVYDFQSFFYWTFPVHAWFKIIDPPNTHMVIHCAKRKDADNKKCKLLRKIIGLFMRSNTWRIFTGSQDDKLPYVAKFTMMFSVIMMIFAVTFVCYGVPSLDLADSFTEYIEIRIRTSIFVITFVTPICTYILHTILLYFFRHSENQFEVNMYRYTFTVRVICWIVMILNICISLIFLLIFGFCMLCIPSIIWLISVIGALVFYIMILENIALAFAGSIKDTTKLIYGRGKWIVEQIESQRVKLYARFGKNLLRPQCEHLYRPLNPREIKKKRLKVLAKEDLKKHIGDFVMLCIYLITLYMVMLITRSENAVFSNLKMGQILRGEVTHTLSYKRVRSINDFLNYTEHTIMKAAYEPVWYGRYVISDPGLMVDVANKYLGVIRFRQHRAVRDSCKVPDKMHYFSKSCIHEYYLAPDEESYDPKWQKIKGGKSNYSDVARYENMWKYQDSGSWTVGGKFASYPPSGYMFSLGRTLKNSMVNFRHMKNTSWLDNGTRAIMIEFLTLSANNNLFNSLLVLVEISATGYVASTHSIDTIKIFFNENDLSLERFILFSIFFVILALFSFRIIFLFVRDRRRFFKDFWRYMDFLIVIVSIICIFLYIHRTNTIIDFLEELETSKKNKFLSYFKLFLVGNVLTCFCGFLIFLATLRLWRLLRFRLMFRIMERTLFLSLAEIFTMAFYYTAILSSCAVMFTAFFGSYDENFRQFRFSSLSLLLITVDMLEDTTVGDSVAQSGFYRLGYLVYGVFSIFSVYAKFLLISIIISNYQASRLYFSNEDDRYDVGTYVKEEITYYMTLYRIRMHKIRLRSGKEGDTQHVTPKADEYRYSGLISISEGKLYGMNSITRCLLSHDLKDTEKIMTKYEMKLILTMLYHHFIRVSEEREFFFKAYVDGRCHLVSDKRIELMAAITNILVTDLSKKETETVTVKDTHALKKWDEINFTLIAHLDLLNGVTIS